MTRPVRRRGFALIECLVLITVMATLLGLCAGTIHLLLQLDRSGRDASEQAADLARLARDFRADAHAAARVDPPGRSALNVVLSDGGWRTVEYAVRPGDILRTVRDGDEIGRRETYRRPARAPARIELTRDGPGPILALVIDRPTGVDPVSSAGEFRIEADLGKHQTLNPRPE
jgi:type II secretory pathway component PulJ